MLPFVASVRSRQRKDDTVYTSFLYTLMGKQTSSSFNDHAEARRFQDVCSRLGAAEASASCTVLIRKHYRPN